MKRALSSLGLGLGLGLGLALVVGGCGKTPEPRDCDRLLDHVVELELTAGGAATTDEAKAARAAQKKKVTGYVGEDFVATCLSDLPIEQLECGLAADTLDELARCDET